MHTPMIAITGGPCGGKSTFLVRAREFLERHGFHLVVVSETATELITAGITPHTLGLLNFQRHLVQYALLREEQYKRAAVRLAPQRTVILCDRGIVDAAAYMESTEYRSVLEDAGTTHSVMLHRYLMVVHLVSAAVGAEEHYTHANNAARTESAEEAQSLELRTQRAWLGHPHHVIIDNSTDFERKQLRAMRALARTLHMPEPMEVERKFLVRSFDLASLLENAVATKITQHYLKSHDGTERRVRKRVQIDDTRYFYTEKVATGTRGTRIEREREISLSEYLMLLSDVAPNTHPIQKTRYCFPFAYKLFELDVFEGRHKGLVLLEVELQDITEEFVLPSMWDIVEVTDDPAYSNRALAYTP